MSRGELIFVLLLIGFFIVTTASCKCIHQNCVTVTRLP